MRHIVLIAAFAVLAVSALLGSGSPASAASCGANNQRPCTIFERIPSCNKGLYEDFGKGKCLRKHVAGKTCGRNNQVPCPIWVRVPSCNNGLVENFAKGKCVKPARGVRPGIDCGRENQRACTIVERIPSCNSGLVEVLGKGICVRNAPGEICGRENQRPCTLTERIPSCNPGLVENFIHNKCVATADTPRFRLADQKFNELGRFIASKIVFAQRTAANPSVKNALGNNRQALDTVVNRSAIGSTQMPDGYLLRTLTVGASAGAKVIVGGSAGAGAAIDLTGRRPAYLYGTAEYGVSFGVGASAGIDVGFWVCQNNKIGGDSWGVEFSPVEIAQAAKTFADLKKAFKPGLDVGIGMWFDYKNVFQGFTITPNVGAGVDFGGLVKAGTVVDGDPSVDCQGNPKSAGQRPLPVQPIQPDVLPSNGGVTLYQHCDYQGYSLHVPAGKHALAELQARGMRNDDISSIRVTPGSQATLFVNNGFNGPRQTHTRNVRCLVDTGYNDVLSAIIVQRAGMIAPAPESAPRVQRLAFIQDIRMGHSVVRHSKVTGGARNRATTRICLRNLTGRAKSLEYQFGHINPLRAKGQGTESCANFPSNRRLNFAWTDNRRVLKKDGMNLSAYAGDIVIFDWLSD